MSLIAQHELQAPKAIIDTVKHLKVAHKEIKPHIKRVGYEHSKGYVELIYLGGMVSLTFVELWPLEINKVYDRALLNERQRKVLEDYFFLNFGVK